MATYEIEMSDGGGGNETITVEAADLDEAREAAEGRLAEWIRDGEWGDEGASVPAYYVIRDGEGEVLDKGAQTVDVEPDHDALIRRAGGDPKCDHDWTGEGEGGCDENPGVWSVGGTAMVFSSHCRKCGLHKRERTTGSQRNPGEHDTVEYTQPETWCPECRREECECETAEADGDEG